MNLLGVVLGSLVNALLLSIVARRLLGVPVGWPRTFLLSLFVNAGMVGLLGWVLDSLGLDRTLDADRATTEAAAVQFLVLALALAWIVAVEVGLLAILEALAPTGTLPGPVELVRTLPARLRRLRRYVAIAGIVLRHGLGRYLTPRGGRSGPPSAATAQALRRALTAGGVTFVKLGQMLSTRPDLLPPAYIDELEKLTSDVPAQPWSVVRETLRAELGQDPEAVFASVEPEPLAAASVGQVHRAVLQDGTLVVIKVQRSDARAQVTADLDIVNRLAAWLQRTAPWARSLGVRDLAAGFAASLAEELDYRVEAGNVAAVAAALPEGSSIRVPTVYADLTSSRVLVMEQMPGRPLSRAREEVAGLDVAQRKALADALLSTVLGQVLGTGIFHADLHAGNVLLTADGTLSLLDFGAVGRLDRGARTTLGLLMLAVDRQDAAAATQAVTDLLDAPPTLDDRALERDLGGLIMRFGTAQGQAAEMFVALLRLVLRHGLSVPPGVAAAFRSLGALEGTLRTLDPRLDLVAAARGQGRDLVAERLSPEGLKAEFVDQLATWVPMMQRLPRRISSVVEDLNNGTLTVTVRTLASTGERRFVTGLVQQVVMTLLAATSAICGVMLALYAGGPTMAGELRLTTFLGLVALLFAFVLGCRAAVLIFRSDDHRPDV